MGPARRLFVIVGAALTCLPITPTWPAEGTAQAENTGPNVNLVRTASGRYSYRTLSDGRDRGSEHFQLLVHADGSRTIMIWHDLAARNAQFTVVLRVAESFRPITAFVSYWVANGYKGSATFQVHGNRLEAAYEGPAGTLSEEIGVPDRFSIGTHPVSADGWHLWYAAESCEEINLYSLEASADLAKPVLGKLVKMPCQTLGAETVETPAGLFDTIHYRLAGSSDLWVTGADRILVRMVQERFDREYLLVDYVAGGANRR